MPWRALPRTKEAIFIDESAVNKRIKDRLRGWSIRGVPYRVLMPYKRSIRYSICLAIDINGYLNYEIYHGSFNAERFNNFIWRLLLKINLYPRP